MGDMLATGLSGKNNTSQAPVDALKKSSSTYYGFLHLGCGRSGDIVRDMEQST
jgi:hypothetical protein